MVGTVGNATGVVMGCVVGVGGSVVARVVAVIHQGRVDCVVVCLVVLVVIHQGSVVARVVDGVVVLVIHHGSVVALVVASVVGGAVVVGLVVVGLVVVVTIGGGAIILF